MAATGACVAGLCLAAGVASAEWRLDGSLAETLETSTNRQLQGNDDPAYGTTTNLNLTVSVLDPRTRWSTTLGVAGAKFFGSGAEPEFDRLDPNFSTAFQHRLSRWTLGLNGSFDVQPTSATQVEDTGVTNLDVTQFSSRANATATLDIDARNSATATTTVSAVRFSEDVGTLTATTRYGLDVSWRHAVNRRLSTSLSAGAAHLLTDNPARGDTTSAHAAAGVTYSPHPRLRLSASLGPNASQPQNSNQGDDKISIGATGALGLDWRIDNATTLALNASQGLEAGSAGTLDSVARISGNMAHAFNETLQGGMRLSYLQRTADAGFTPLNADVEIFSASPNLSVALTPDWRAQAGYAVTLARRAERSDEMSNRLFFTLSTSF